MPRYLVEPARRHDAPGKTAVLLINLGTPEAPTAPALRRYLREFLSDPRVVELPRPLWWPILNGVILNTRPRKSAEKYATVWLPEGSPLKVHTERQSKLLRGLLGQAGLHVVVDYAMRYGQPSIPSVLTRLKAEGCNRILLLPLYPQYAASTSATALDAAFAWARETRNQPELRTVRSFADHPGYIEALAASVREHWANNGQPDDAYRLLMSFHGLPRYTLDKGDPYYCECLKTGRLLAQALALPEERHAICFQSRFGRSAWLQPYTAPTLREFARQGIRRVDVICPGFPADCLETLEEIAIEGRTEFIQAGGREYHYIHSLNERDDWMRALADIAARHLQGWPTDAAPPAAELQACVRRAQAFGAPS